MSLTGIVAGLWGATVLLTGTKIFYLQPLISAASRHPLPAYQVGGRGPTKGTHTLAIDTRLASSLETVYNVPAATSRDADVSLRPRPMVMPSSKDVYERQR